MTILNCKNCKRLFNAMVDTELCPECNAKLEQKFQEVKKYLYEHEQAKIEEVSKENNISIKQLKKWVQEERLTFKSLSSIGLACSFCGRTISSGKYCKECKTKLLNDLNAVNTKKITSSLSIKKSEQDKMRFLK